MRLLLVRHGESNAIARGVVGGPTGCTGLTPRGVAQAEALRDRFRDEAVTVDALLSSPLPRACQTARIVGEAFGLEAVLDADLRELDPGEADGIAWDEWRQRYGFDMMAEPDRPQSPGGDSLNSFRERIAKAIDRLRADHDGRTVVATCHGGPIFMAMNLLFGAETGLVRMRADFTSVTEFEAIDGHWVLHRFNDVAHVRGTDLLAPDDG